MRFGECEQAKYHLVVNAAVYFHKISSWANRHQPPVACWIQETRTSRGAGIRDKNCQGKSDSTRIRVVAKRKELWYAPRLSG